MSDMHKNWKTCSIEDLGEINRGKSKHRPRNASILFGGEYPFIQTADVKKANLYITEYSETYNEVGLAQSKLWKKGTLCITIAANIAESAVLGIDACFPDSVVGFEPYVNVADTKYVKYMMDMFKVYMQQISKGTTQDNLSLAKIRKVKFEAPNYEKQKEIARILSTYDDLIENNNKRIGLLEKMAENIYKEWFVRFRFPGYENTEFEHGFPKGWEIRRLGAISNIRAGGDAPKDYSNEKSKEYNVPIYSNGISNDGLYGYTNRGTVSGKSITVSARGTVGFVCLRFGEYLPIVRLLSIEPDDSMLDVYYLYFCLKNGQIDGYGTSQQQITIPFFKRKKIIIPQLDLQKKYNSIGNALFKETQLLKQKNTNLIKQRDLLLPRLMSGKLEVK